MEQPLDPHVLREINELLRYHKEDLAAANYGTKKLAEGTTEAAKAEADRAARATAATQKVSSECNNKNYCSISANS